MMNQNEDWKLIGYWPKILQRIHLLDRNIESILTKEASQQCYLNASIYGLIKSSSKHVTVASKRYNKHYHSEIYSLKKNITGNPYLIFIINKIFKFVG